MSEIMKMFEKAKNIQQDPELREACALTFGELIDTVNLMLTKNPALAAQLVESQKEKLKEIVELIEEEKKED